MPQEHMFDEIALAPPSSSSSSSSSPLARTSLSSEIDEDQEQQQQYTSVLNPEHASSSMFSWFHLIGLNNNNNNNVTRSDPILPASNTEMENHQSSTNISNNTVSDDNRLLGGDNMMETNSICNDSLLENDFFSSCSSRVVTIAASPDYLDDADDCSSSGSVASNNRNITQQQTSSSTMRQQQQQHDNEQGSSIRGAIFNFTNCIVGAGAIGLGGAFAESGGLISVVSVIFFAFLVKQSTDLVLELSLAISAENDSNNNSNSNNSPTDNNSNSDSHQGSSNSNRRQHLATYEELGQAAYGAIGRLLVLCSKFLYAFGCLIAYTKVIQDNFGTAVKNIIYGSASSTSNSNTSWLYWLLNHDTCTTYVISSIVILPLCLLRDMTPLAWASFLSIAAMFSIIAIVFYYWAWGEVFNENDNRTFMNDFDLMLREETTIFVANFPANKSDHYHLPPAAEAFHRHWLEIRWNGYFNNVGTFLFSFVCQHTAHMTFNSLKPRLRTLKKWKKVSATSLTLSTILSLAVGLLVYMTFWQDAVSDMFQLYPATILMNVAKLLLCITMLLTFPLPFFTCRELLVVLLFPLAPTNNNNDPVINTSNSSDTISPSTVENGNLEIAHVDTLRELREPLLSRDPLTRKARTHSNGEETHCSFYTARSQNSALDSTVAGNGNENHLVGSSNVVHEEADIGSLTSLRRMRSNESAISLNDISILSTRALQVMNSCLLPDQERQLKLPFHFAVSVKMWFVVTSLAVAAPSLGDILALVGCASGTLIAFILPGLFALKLQGIRPLVVVILLVGGTVGVIGTSCSLRKFAADTIL